MANNVGEDQPHWRKTSQEDGIVGIFCPFLEEASHLEFWRPG